MANATHSRNASVPPARTGNTNPPQRSRRTPPAPDQSATDRRPQDVWDWTGRKYRVRAVLLLVLNIALFCGLAFFAFWLRTGHVFTPTFAGYGQMLATTFSTSQSSGITPGSLLEFPINVIQVPMQGVVLGLLLAALVSVPIMVAMFYRFPVSIPFLLVVAFLAMMPWLAITLCGSCILSSVKPFKFRSKYASALLGLLPVILYLVMASLRTGDAVEAMPSPADHMKYLVPWVFALVAACVLLAIGVTSARAVNYRPGGVAPLLAAMFATPVLLFEFHVGRDELYYRLLESAWKEAFVDQDVSALFDAAVREDWLARSNPRPQYRAAADQLEFYWRNQVGGPLSAGRISLVQLQQHIVSQAEWFALHYPDSRYAVNAHYIEATTHDTRIDMSRLRDQKQIKHYRNFPAEASRKPWKIVWANRPESSMAAVAALRIAQLDAREGKIEEAIQSLRRMLSRYSLDNLDSQGPGPNGRELLAAESPQSTIQVPLEETLLEAHQLLDFLTHNEDPRYGQAPLIGTQINDDPGLGFLRLDPGDVNYRRNLQALLDRYPNAEIEDNVQLILAMTESDPKARLEGLQRCLEEHPRGDTFAEAKYREAQALLDIGDPESARAGYEQLIADFPQTPWAASARERLRKLPSPPEPAKGA